MNTNDEQGFFMPSLKRHAIEVQSVQSSCVVMRDIDAYVHKKNSPPTFTGKQGGKHLNLNQMKSWIENNVNAQSPY